MTRIATGLAEVARERILILDGALGTMLQSYGLTEADFHSGEYDLPGQQAGNNDVLTLTRPDVVADVHRRYLEAGADIIETNTFSAQRISMRDYSCGHLVREINLEAARLARRLADEYGHRTPHKPRFVAGSVGPTNKTCSMSPDVNDPALREVTFDELADAYGEQMDALLEGGVDALLIETIFDTLNAKAALFAAERTMRQRGRRVPLMLSATVADRSGRTLSGQTLRAFLASVSQADVFSVGLNCSFGARELRPFLRELAACAPCYVSVYPNAGLPNSLGQYDETPEDMAREMGEFVKEGHVNIIGGCCGTTDRFIAQYDRLVRRSDGTFVPPHVPAPRPPHLWLSGLELTEVRPENNFTNIGERCNVAGSRKFLRLMKEKAYDEAVAIARKQVEDGAQVIDINMDDGLLDAEAEMTHFLNLLAAEPDVARVPFMIDSSKWDVIRAALKCVQGKCIVNSISLKEGEDVFLSHARELKSLGAAAVVMAFDERGQATTYERRIEICSRAYRLLTEQAGFCPQDIIFDPNVLSICTGMAEHDNYAADFIRATAWIRAHLQGAHVSGGVSNLSFSFRGNNYLREAMHAVFLYHAIRAGMDMGIVNPAAKVTYGDIPADLVRLLEDAILNRHPDAAERLIEAAQKMQAEAVAGGGANSATATKQEGWRKKPVADRLRHAIVKGIPDHLEDDLGEQLEAMPRAVDIIEGPLMDGMNEVGDLFGAGKMFLPQVVKTARTMKRAVDILRPRIEAEKTEGHQAGRIVMATVKGDVHDIGKNIVAVVLACNNFDVTDLGVMTPAEDIIAAAREQQADLVGLSGLITPSLDEMVNVARAMQEAGLRIPLLLGGATTSRLHTALKIAPEYEGPVCWVRDASQMVVVASKLMNPAQREDFVRANREEQERLRTEYNRPKESSDDVVGIEEARGRKLKLFDD